MKKLIQINTVCNGSVGNIMRAIQSKAQDEGYNTLTFYGRRKGYADLSSEKFGSYISFWLHVIWNTITDKQGLFSSYWTKKMIRRLKEEKPDIIHLHNLHGYYLNYKILFEYLRNEYKGNIVWTFHDCWPVTGHCPHFVIANCEKWKSQCGKCPNKNVYPISWFADSSKPNFKLKKKMFSNIENMIIICPSLWMKNIVEQSFLGKTNNVVIHNGISLDIFFPRKSDSILKKYNIPKNKIIILGVASIWEERKGLGIFLDIARELDDKYCIVLVGINKFQKKKLPANIVGIERTENRDELSELYSCAGVLLNPSREESFSLVTVEAMACGTPVIVLDSSAVQELVKPETGIVLHNPETITYIQSIEEVLQKEWNKDIIRSHAKKYDINDMVKGYLNIYKEI